MTGHTQAQAQAPVVAYLGNAVPVELIVAAGCVPVMMHGDPEEDTPLGDLYLDDDFDGDLRSVYQRIVSGHYNFASLIVIPRSSNGYLYLYYFLIETKRLRAEPFPEVVLFDVLQTPFWSTGQYVYQRVYDLQKTLERVTGKAISEAALSSAIAACNHTRSTLLALNDLRRAVPPRVSGTAMLRAIAGAADTVPQAGLQGLRVMVKGAPHDDTRFYALAESLGCVIVADDHTTGERAIEHLVDETLPPVAALADHYHLHAPGIRSFPQAAQDARFMEIVAAASVQAVIFFHDEYDDTLGWDYPEQKRLLDARGIPSVFLQAQSYRHPDGAAQRAAIADLIARSAA